MSIDSIHQADKCDWDKQDAITDEQSLQEYKRILTAFLADFTQLDATQFNELSIVTAKNYYEYRLLIDDTAISRCFKQYTKKNSRKRNFFR